MRKIAFLLLALLFVNLPLSAQTKTSSFGMRAGYVVPPIHPGAISMGQYLPLLKGKKVGVVVNHTSFVGNSHLLDTLLAHKVEIVRIFAPEHGLRGNASYGEKVANGVDSKTGLPVISLYGKNYKPTAAQVSDLDVIVFDIQDVGVRFYTYISTLHYVMEACAEHGKKVIVLDRPNPNGHYVDGPILELKHKSFVGMHPIPIVYGLTIGELATMINGEGWLSGQKTCDLTVIKCLQYTHKSMYSLPIKPSPNLPNDLSIALYPSTCLFEGTSASLGRGTDFPFQVAGSPDYPDKGFSFTPKAWEGAKNPPHKDVLCYGIDYRSTSLPMKQIKIEWIIDYYHKIPSKDKFFIPFLTQLMGSENFVKQIKEGKSPAEIRETWKQGLEEYKEKRKKYLLYEDF